MNAQLLAGSRAPRASHDASGATLDRGQLLLSAEQLQQFALQGFLALPDFCSDAELARIREVLCNLFRDRIGHEEGKQFDMLGLDLGASMRQPQIINPSTFAPELLRTEHFARLTAVARQLLGPYAQFSFDHSILKPAHSVAATPWHQDEAHHDHHLFRYPQISFWMALQDTSIENGCMRYVPGSHLGPLLPHRPLNNDPRIHAIECSPEFVDEARALDQPVRAGTVIFHEGRTLHAALPNTSSVNRMAYICAFVGPPEPMDMVSSRSMFKRGLQRNNEPANVQRRARWLRRGGFVTLAMRRLRQGLRSNPRMLWWKIRLLLLRRLAERLATRY